MPDIYTNHVISCAAILLAVAVLGLSPKWARQSCFAVVFGSGILATVAGVVAATTG